MAGSFLLLLPFGDPELEGRMGGGREAASDGVFVKAENLGCGCEEGPDAGVGFGISLAVGDGDWNSKSVGFESMLESVGQGYGSSGIRGRYHGSPAYS